MVVIATGIALVISWGGAFVYHPDGLMNLFMYAAAPGVIPASILGLLLGYGHGAPDMAMFLLSLPFNLLFYAVLFWAFEVIVRAVLRKRHHSISQD